jgi:nucleoside-diphosphate kinase
MVLDGFGVIEGVRKLLGNTSPAAGDVGTIRDDYSLDTYQLADYISRSTRTMIHASDSVENANREIAIWFKESELCDNYETAAEKIFYDEGWGK